MVYESGEMRTKPALCLAAFLKVLDTLLYKDALFRAYRRTRGFGYEYNRQYQQHEQCNENGNTDSVSFRHLPKNPTGPANGFTASPHVGPNPDYTERTFGSQRFDTPHTTA